MVKLLDQYSERLVSILDEKIAASMALRVRENSESGLSTGLASPDFEREEKIQPVSGGDAGLVAGTEGSLASDESSVTVPTVEPTAASKETITEDDGTMR